MPFHCSPCWHSKRRNCLNLKLACWHFSAAVAPEMAPPLLSCNFCTYIAIICSSTTPLQQSSTEELRFFLGDRLQRVRTAGIALAQTGCDVREPQGDPIASVHQLCLCSVDFLDATTCQQVRQFGRGSTAASEPAAASAKCENSG